MLPKSQETSTKDTIYNIIYENYLKFIKKFTAGGTYVSSNLTSEDLYDENEHVLNDNFIEHLMFLYDTEENYEYVLIFLDSCIRDLSAISSKDVFDILLNILILCDEIFMELNINNIVFKIDLTGITSDEFDKIVDSKIKIDGNYAIMDFNQYKKLFFY